MKEHTVLAVDLGANFFDVLKIDDRRAVNTEEDRWVEFFFEVRHRLAEEMRFALSADADVVLFGADPEDLRDRHKDDASLRFKDNAGRVVFAVASFRGGRMGILLFGLNMLQGALCGSAKSILCEGFQQIIDGVDLEGAECVTVVCRREDDAWEAMISGGKGADDVEAIHIWHTDIEEEEIGVGGAHQIDRLCSSCALADDLYFGYLAKELPQLLSCKDFVICNNGLNHHPPYLAGFSIGRAECCKGSVTTTRTALFSISEMEKLWSEP